MANPKKPARREAEGVKSPRREVVLVDGKPSIVEMVDAPPPPAPGDGLPQPDPSSLRDLAQKYRARNGTDGYSLALLRAADAIEALRAERDAANDARGEICADLIAAQYKIAKLRGALKKIAANSEDAADPNLSPSDSYGNGDDVFRDGMRQADFYTAQIARAALAQNGGNDDAAA